MSNLRRAAAVAAAVLLAGGATLGAAPIASAATTDSGAGRAPTAPTNLRITQIGFDTVSLAWGPSSDDSGRVEFYPVFANGRWASGSYGTEVTLRYLTHGTTYQIDVYAIDGEGHWSAPARTAVTTVRDAQPPATPANLRTASGGSALLWDQSTDNRGVSHYRLFADGVWVASWSLGVEFRTLTDVLCVLTRGRTYTFTVRAADTSGLVSQQGNPITVTVP
jgi:chitodextrinase